MRLNGNTVQIHMMNSSMANQKTVKCDLANQHSWQCLSLFNSSEWRHLNEKNALLSDNKLRKTRTTEESGPSNRIVPRTATSKTLTKRSQLKSRLTCRQLTVHMSLARTRQNTRPKGPASAFGGFQWQCSMCFAGHVSKASTILDTSRQRKRLEESDNEMHVFWTEKNRKSV